VFHGFSIFTSILPFREGKVETSIMFVNVPYVIMIGSVKKAMCVLTLHKVDPIDKSMAKRSQVYIASLRVQRKQKKN